MLRTATPQRRASCSTSTRWAWPWPRTFNISTRPWRSPPRWNDAWCCPRPWTAATAQPFRPPFEQRLAWVRLNIGIGVWKLNMCFMSLNFCVVSVSFKFQILICCKLQPSHHKNMGLSVSILRPTVWTRPWAPTAARLTTSLTCSGCTMSTGTRWSLLGWRRMWLSKHGGLKLNQKRCELKVERFNAC